MNDPKPTTTHCVMILVDVTVPAGQAAAVDTELARCTQQIRHRLVGHGVQIGGAEGSLLPGQTRASIRASFALALEALRRDGTPR